MANPEWDNYKTPEQRYRILADESGHEYFIPVGPAEAEFEEWVRATEEDEDPGDLDFNNNRIDGRFTFTDPRCD